MPDVLMNIDFWIVVTTLVGVIWYQKKQAVTHAQINGFKTGAALGMIYGVTHATEILTSGKYSLTSEEGGPVYANELLFDEVMTSAREHLIKNPDSLFLFKD